MRGDPLGVTDRNGRMIRAGDRVRWRDNEGEAFSLPAGHVGSVIVEVDHRHVVEVSRLDLEVVVPAKLRLTDTYFDNKPGRVLTPELLILAGLPGAGKSMLAALITHNDACLEEHAKNPYYGDVKCRDRNHRYFGAFSLDEIRDPFLHYQPWSRALEDEIMAIADQNARSWLRLGMPLVLEATNLTVEARRHWVNLAHAEGVPARICWVAVPEEESVARQKDRLGNGVRVPEQRVREMAANMQVPSKAEADDLFSVVMVPPLGPGFQWSWLWYPDVVEVKEHGR